MRKTNKTEKVELGANDTEETRQALGKIAAELTAKHECPLWRKGDVEYHGHANQCCREVGCKICTNQWCVVGNPYLEKPPFNGKPPLFEGYIAVITNGVAITYLRIEDNMAQAHDPLKAEPEAFELTAGPEGRALYRRKSE